MKKCIIACVALILLAGLVPVAAFAQTTTTGQTPNVSNLKAFSAEADFMSLPGYLRYLMFQQTGQWLTYIEASRIVQQQNQ